MEGCGLGHVVIWDLALLIAQEFQSSPNSNVNDCSADGDNADGDNADGHSADCHNADDDNADRLSGEQSSDTRDTFHTPTQSTQVRHTGTIRYHASPHLHLACL
jgi:hypothetical protein